MRSIRTTITTSTTIIIIIIKIFTIIIAIIIIMVIRSMSKRLAEEARTRRTNRMLIAMVSFIYTCICICICLYLYLSSLNEKASYHQLIGQLVLYGSILAGWQKSNPEYTQKSSQLLERKKQACLGVFRLLFRSPGKCQREGKLLQSPGPITLQNEQLLKEQLFKRVSTVNQCNGM